MKLWLISQDVNNDYDTYDCAVVAAVDEDAARHTHPRGFHSSTVFINDMRRTLPRAV